MEPLTPPSLHITEHGDRLRGQIRLAMDETKIRQLFWSALSAVVLMFMAVGPLPGLLDYLREQGTAPEFLTDTLVMGIIYCSGFLLLVIAAWSLFGVVQLPQTIELDPRRFSIGDDEFKVEGITQVDATDGPPKLVLVLRSGKRFVWEANANHHNVDDLAWLAEQVRARTEHKA